MVLNTLLHTLPAKADKEARAQRKKWEKEHPHFQMQEFGLKAGVLALMGAVALYPGVKKYEDHVEEKHPERLEGRGRDGRDRERDGGRRGDERDRGDGRRRSLGGERGRDERRRSVGVGERRDVRRDGGRERETERRRNRSMTAKRTTRPPQAYTGVRRIQTEEMHGPARRRSVDAKALKMAVADGYEYIPARNEGRGVERRDRRDGVGRRDGRRSLDGYEGRRGVREVVTGELGRGRRGSGEVRFR